MSIITCKEKVLQVYNFYQFINQVMHIEKRVIQRSGKDGLICNETHVHTYIQKIVGKVNI